MSTQPLAGISVVEAGTFVAAPSAGMALRQLGAHVTRVDLPGGGSDSGRWPVASSGGSLYWAGLNKGKRSVLIDYRQAEGRELLIALATVPGPESGVFLHNMVGRHRPTYEELARRRPDVIHLRVEGRADGSASVDYTANASLGIPQMTGFAGQAAPVNHVLPAWDLLTGMTAATGLLAALRLRDQTGEGSTIHLALDDVALSAVGALGWLAAALIDGCPRPAMGNYVYGSFGVDFETSDAQRVMVVALTTGHWRGLCEATGTSAVFAALEKPLDADFSQESERFRLRDAIAGVLTPWFAARTLKEIGRALDSAKVLWGPYNDMLVAAQQARAESPLVVELDQDGVGSILATANPLRWDGAVTPPEPAPVLGADTETVLASSLGLSPLEIARLVDGRVVATDRSGVA